MLQLPNRPNGRCLATTACAQEIMKPYNPRPPYPSRPQAGVHQPPPVEAVWIFEGSYSFGRVEGLGFTDKGFSDGLRVQSLKVHGKVSKPFAIPVAKGSRMLRA